jgi:hypothetical protein
MKPIPYEFLDTDDVRQLLLGFKIAVCSNLNEEDTKLVDETFERFSHNEKCSPPVKASHPVLPEVALRKDATGYGQYCPCAVALKVLAEEAVKLALEEKQADVLA